MNDRHPPSPIGPAEDPADLPDVFDGLIAIDVVDGELVPRESEPPRA